MLRKFIHRGQDGLSRWTSIDPKQAKETVALEVMSKNRFDVLPIEKSKDSPVKEVFVTTERNVYSTETVIRRHIDVHDILPISIPISMLVKEFATSKRLFYMLVSENSIIGIVTLSNLNSRPVRVWLFSLLCEYETRLGNLIKDRISEEKIIEEIKDSNNGRESIKRYEEDKRNGVDNHICEYLYLSSLVNIFTKHKFFQELSYKNRKEFEKLNTINEIRKLVMHPVRSIITSEKSLNTLFERLNKLTDVLFRLSNC